MSYKTIYSALSTYIPQMFSYSKIEIDEAIKKEQYIKTYIGKYIKLPKRNAVIITDIRYVAGYPENFPPYYTIYSINSLGKEYFIINLPEDEFNENNELFVSTTSRT